MLWSHRIVPSTARLALQVRVACACFLAATALPAQVASIDLRNLESINTAEDEFSPTVTADGKILVFNSKRGGRYQDLYTSTFRDGKWSQPVPLKELNSPFNDETPFLSADGKTIFFASDRDGSFEMPKDAKGQIRVSFDLYWSHHDGKAWSAPQKLPGQVNTPAHERSPTIQRSTGRLFFSRWPFGDFQQARLMVATFSDRGFVDLKEVQLPIAKGEQIHALIPGKGDTFFFTARMKGSLGGWDVYRARLDGLKFTDIQNLGAGINTPADEMYFSLADNRIFLCSNRPAGKGKFDIYSYGLEEQFAALEKKEGFTTQAILFDFDQATLQPESTGILDDLAAYLKEHPDLRLRIVGHTDLSGKTEYNQRLSLERARSVRAYLVEQGLAENRFEIEGAGESRPLVAGNSAEAGAQNRRTEFQVLGK